MLSILTPTWQRHEELTGLLENIREQTVVGQFPIQHVIVSDGPDPHVYNVVRDGMHINIEYTIVECGLNWSSFLPDSHASIPIMTACHLAKYEYMIMLSDDERMLCTDYLGRLASLLDDGFDFAYSRVLMELAASNHRYVIGRYPPSLGEITNFMFRRDLLKLAMYRPFAGKASDWDLVNRWLQQGATCAMLPDVAFYHRADK